MHRGQVVLEPVSTAAGKQLQTLYGDAAWDVDDLDSDYDNAFRAGWRWYPVPAVRCFGCLLQNVKGTFIGMSRVA